MIATVLLNVFSLAVPGWLKGPLKWLVDLTIVAAVLGGIYFWIHSDGEKKGAAKVTAKVERQRAERIAEAKADTTRAQATVDAIGATTRNSNRLATEFAQAQIKELRDATTVPPAAAGDPAPVIDGVRIDASLNALLDRANGAGEAADRDP